MREVWLIWIAAAYLCGSVPFGLLIGNARGVDVRKLGSGNIGATNVSRVLGKKWGILCFALDVLKGLAPVLAAGLFMGCVGQANLDSSHAWPWLAVGAAAVVGHVFPVWLHFRGGKGMATALGVLLGFWPVLTLPALLALVTWVLLTLTFRYVSLASILGAIVLPFYVLAEARLTATPLGRVLPFLIVSSLLALLVVARHHSNIRRLLRGTENKIGAGHTESGKP